MRSRGERTTSAAAYSRSPKACPARFNLTVQ